MASRSLRTLVSVAELGSFAKVAERRNMTLSAVSMQMKTLERELAVALFDRSFRPPKLTPIGRSVARRARAVLAAEDELLEICAAEDTLRGDFRIGFVLTASVRVLPGFLARAATAAPAARFHVETGLSEDLEERVRRGDLDAAMVTRSDAADVGLTVTRLAREEIVFAVPAASAERSLEDVMASLPFLQFMPRTGIGLLIAQRLKAENLTPAKTVVLDGIEAIVECVKAGIGFTALPRPDLMRYIRDEAVLRPMPRPLFRDLALVTLGGSAADRLRPELCALLSPRRAETAFTGSGT